MHPIYCIGSEVPIPGGAQEAEDSVAVTSPEAFEHTVETFKRAFETAGHLSRVLFIGFRAENGRKQMHFSAEYAIIKGREKPQDQSLSGIFKEVKP